MGGRVVLLNKSLIQKEKSKIEAYVALFVSMFASCGGAWYDKSALLATARYYSNDE